MRPNNEEIKVSVLLRENNPIYRNSDEVCRCRIAGLTVGGINPTLYFGTELGNLRLLWES